MIDYDIYYRDSLSELDISNLKDIDIFISAYNESERVGRVYNKIVAKINFGLYSQNIIFQKKSLLL